MKLRDLPDLEDVPGTTRRLLHEILSEVRALRADLAQRERPAACAPAELELLREIAKFVGSDLTFSAAELLDSADATLSKALAGLDALTLGRLLARLEGARVGALRLQRVRKSGQGIVWCLVPDDS